MTVPRVLVVRSGANPFARLPSADGVELVERASHSIEPLAVPDAALDRRFDLVLFTSQVAVERLLADARLAPRLRGAVEMADVVAVGPSTEGALRRHGLPPSRVANGSGEAILESLPSRLEGKRVLLPRAEDATPELPEGLSRRGASITLLPVYRKVPVPSDSDLARQIVERPFRAFCVTSPSAATWLFAGLPEAAARRLRETPAVVLGPYTRRYLESRGVSRIAVAEAPHFDAAARLLETLARVPPG